MVADHDIGMSMDREASRYVPRQVYTSGMRVREYRHTPIWARWVNSLGNIVEISDLDTDMSNELIYVYTIFDSHIILPYTGLLSKNERFLWGHATS